MSLTAEEEAELASLLEEEAQSIRLGKSGRAQEAARASSGAPMSRDDIAVDMGESSTSDKVAAGAQGFADAVSFAPQIKGAAAAMGAPVKRATGSDTAARIVGGALMALGGIPMVGPAHIASLVEHDDYARARDEQEAASRAAAGDHPDTDAIEVNDRGAVYGAGHLTGDAFNALDVAKGPLREAAKAIGAKVTPHVAPAVKRMKGAADELMAESLEGGAAPTARGALWRSIKALVGRGGEVKPSQIVDEADVAAPSTRPEWLTSLVDDTAPVADDVESGLALARPPPMPKGAKRGPRAKAEPKAEPEAPAPEPTREQVREQVLDEMLVADAPAEVAPSIVKRPDVANIVADTGVKPSTASKMAAGREERASIAELAANVKAMKSGERMKEIERLAKLLGPEKAKKVANAANVPTTMLGLGG